MIKHAGEGAHERRTDQLTQNFGRLIERAHGMHHAEHRRDDTKCGHAVGHRLQCAIWLELVVHHGLKLFVHERFDFMRACIADDEKTDVVADEGGEILVGENCREPFEDFRFGRVLDMRLDLATLLGADFAHHRVQETKHIEVIAGRRALVENCGNNSLAGILDHFDRVRDDECSQS